MSHSFLYTVAQTRELDRLAIEESGIAGFTLMTRAAEACFAAIEDLWPGISRVHIACGPGNNGGDGFVLARLLAEAGYQAATLELKPGADMPPDAARARKEWMQAGGHAVGIEALTDADLLVDAMLGSGLDRDLDDDTAALVAQINSTAIPVLAVDIPAGLNADTGRIMGAAIVADATVSFIGRKRGMLTASGPDCAGMQLFDDLGVPASVYEKITPSVHSIQPGDCELPVRASAAHKGDCGHVLLVGGNHGMSGAISLAATAALRSGAGLVSVATRASHAALLSVQRPEIMAHGVESESDLSTLLERADVIAIGPGLGQDAWAQGLFARVISAGKPLVVDADALSLLAMNPDQNDKRVLTPHPGEAARLLATSKDKIQQDRFAAVTALQQQYGGVCVLKGLGSLVCDPQGGLFLSETGNPGMASGGMGDLLTGVLAALIAQGESLSQAATKAVYLHGLAGDMAAAVSGERGLLASDLLPQLRKLVNRHFPEWVEA